MTHFKKIRFTTKANRTSERLDQRMLASLIAVAVMVFAAHTYAQTVPVTETNSLSSFREETTTKQKEAKMTQATKEQSATSAEDTSIRPFQVHIPQADLDELRKRILATRWPEKETVSDLSQGVPLATMRELASYWATDYDWRKAEAKLNAFPQFVTNIDGLDIHFIHVRSKNPKALPLIIAHGWLGSILEQIKLISPLTDPTAYGEKAEDAFDVVIPSMPGYGFSGKPTSTGWGPEHMARAWDVLMKRLGYTRYVAQGGDWGALSSTL